MPDDPRDRRTPSHGLHVGKVGGQKLPTNPTGVKVIPSRAITERGGGGGGAGSHEREPRRRPPMLTPAYIKDELQRRIEKMSSGTYQDFEHEEITPINTLAVVWEELRTAIEGLRNDVSLMRADMNQVLGAMKSTNEQWPKMIEQLMTMISKQLNSKRDLEFTVTETELGIKSHREKTVADTAAFTQREKWKTIGKAVGVIVGFIFSVSGATLLANLIMSKC